MRVGLVDPAAFTPPYDHALARALAATGVDVELVTSRFRFGTATAPEGYARRELFYPVSTRIFHRSRVRPSPFGGSATRVLRQVPAEQNGLRARENKIETSGPDVDEELPLTAREREVFELVRGQDERRERTHPLDLAADGMQLRRGWPRPRGSSRGPGCRG